MWHHLEWWMSLRNHIQIQYIRKSFPHFLLPCIGRSWPLSDKVCLWSPTVCTPNTTWIRAAVLAKHRYVKDWNTKLQDHQLQQAASHAHKSLYVMHSLQNIRMAVTKQWRHQNHDHRPVLFDRQATASSGHRKAMHAGPVLPSGEQPCTGNWHKYQPHLVALRLPL